jgi:hypothetical protein
MEISLDYPPGGDLGRFVVSCAFIVAICRCMIILVAERSSAGNKCFTAFGPMKFLHASGLVQ